ncbi:MAG TPA: phosphoribosylanthranilate isomerase, partial [Thermoanaerobaculia bacterium]|nr:phosphoribosylanthranilate isomerase [Thermoanaerobaculia bacterium]
RADSAMTKIKICGLTVEEDAIVAADLGADFLGFIFVESSPRRVDPERVRDIAARVRENRESPPRIVGVFRDASAEYLNRIASDASLDLVQLHGNETDDDIAALEIPAIKSFRVGDTLPDTTTYPRAQWHLFDAFVEHREGGTGRRFDWSLLAMYPRTKPFFLAGGITPENVAAAISLVRPDAVDLASGVESEPGVKDHTKLRNLFERIKR